VSVRLIGNVLVVIAILPAVLSVVVYGRVPWWRSTTGRQLMAMMFSIAVILTFAGIGLWYRNEGWFQLLRIAVFGLFVITMYWQLVLLVKAQWRGRDSRHDTREN
jgi:hypothetical protein